MKTILIALLAFAGSVHAQSTDDDQMGPNSYAGLMGRLHGHVEVAREALIADLQKIGSYTNIDPVPDFDEDFFKKILDDERKFNAALWHLQNPEDLGPNPYESSTPKPHHHHH